MNSKVGIRIRLIFSGIVIVACAIVVALFHTQVIDGNAYAAKAQAQYAKPAISIFDRGSIFFQTRDGTRVTAAGISRGYFVYLNQKLISNASQAYDALSQYITIDKSAFMKSATSKGSYVEFMHKIDQSTADQIQGLGLPGIGVAEEAWRTYPGGTMAAHTLGLLGQTATSTISGRYGLERSYDSVLFRAEQGSTVDVFADLFSGLGSVFGSKTDVQGDVVSTIEPTVQTYLEKVLADTRTKWNSDEIGGIIMDPQTGSIVAMGSLPTFDPNDLSDVPSISVLTDPLVQHVYEMGSIMKPLTMSTALDTGAVTPDTTYNDTGCMVLNTKKICNYDGKARGVIPMQQILSQSLNVGAATIALKVGTDIGKGVFSKYFYSFGLGSTTGIDLPSEASGIVNNLKAATDIDVATAAYGQGIAVSPVEMIRALSILANGGYLVTPHVVDEIDYVDGSKKMIQPIKQGPLLKPETVKDVDTMLVTVVDKAFATGTVSMQHYSIAAKTGTAEMADPVHGGYYSDRYLHSFFGFFPAYDPKYIIFLYQLYPKGAEYASATLTAPFSELSKFLINYYNIPPDR